MSTYVGAHPPPAPAGKPRPGAWWFAVGAALVAAGVVTGIVLFVRIFDSGFLGVEAAVPADGAAHQVVVDTDGDRYLWEPEHGSADCTVRDEGRDAAIGLEPVHGTVTRSADGDSWQAVASFDPGSGHLSVTCADDGDLAQIGPALDVPDFVLRIVLAVVVPLLLSGLGLAVLIGTAILWATRPRRVA